VALRWAPCGPGLSLQAFEAMALPIAIQQTITDVQSHYKKLHEQVLTLQSENLDLKKELQEIGARSHSKVMESLINENHRLKAQVRVIEGPNPPGFAPEEDELISIKTVSLEAPEVRSRIRKVSTQAVHDAVHIRKHMMNGDQESEDGFLASDKIKMLKMDPFADTPMESSPPLFSSVFGLCFPIDIRATEKERLMKRFTNGLFFKSITMLAIAANTLYLGWAANTNVSNSWRRLRNEPVQQPGVEFDIAFTAWFGVELFVKMIADRVQFFVGEERAWNWFDMALVGESFVGLFSQGSKLSFLRIFRVFRLVRVVKVVRSVKALARLRTMIFAILSSFVDLLWAFLVIVLIVFVFAIVFDNAVADYFDSITVDFNATDRDGLAKIQEVEDMNTLFGNLPETMISLWSAVSGGNDWMNYGDYLRTAGGWFYFGLFNFYIAFCVVGMFNVVTGVFVDSAVCVRTGDEVVQGYLDDLRQTTEEIKGFFKDADTDGSGTLNWEEFQSHMKNPAVKAYFSGLDIDPEEAEIIFTILDGDKSKEIKIDEFVHGTMKLKGSATKLDLMALMYDQTRQSMKFDALCDFVEDELVEIKRRLMLARQKEAERNERAPERPQPGTSASPPRATRVRIDTTRDLPRATAVPRRG